MIRLLDERLVNKIAAGEVIDRPMNVIKELVENSVDAGARHIRIEITESMIRVADDGQGMSKEDLQQCILRHATSKISSFEDLEHVSTLGFRGEALASIASVSQLRMLSRTSDSIEGYELCVEAGNVVSFKSCACSPGTIIEVHNLFFNTPVRKKFLDIREDERTTYFLQKFSLGTTVGVRFSLHGKSVLEVHGENLLDRIAQVYGVELVKDMLSVDCESNGVHVQGYVSQPSLVRRDRTMQAFFVNGRLVESDEVSAALYDAYKSLLFVNKHPVAVLTLQMTGVDVNVHPTKKVVKFSSPAKVLAAVFDSIRSVFQQEPLEFNVPEKYIPKTSMLAESAPATTHEALKRFVKEQQHELFSSESNEKKYSHFPELRLLGSLAKTFFLAETEEGLLIIDQHVVEERINYEKFMKQYMNGSVAVQELIQPELIEFGPAEAMTVRRNLLRLQQYGFYLEEFGEDTFRLAKAPVLFKKVKGSELLRDLLIDFKEDEKENIITMMSCKKSIKAGDTVGVAEMYSLLKELDRCELPYTCPHGRPIMVKVSIGDLEKMFRRKGF